MIKPMDISVEQLFHWYVGPIVIINADNGNCYFMGHSSKLIYSDYEYVLKDIKYFTVCLKHKTTVISEEYSAVLEVFI